MKVDEANLPPTNAHATVPVMHQITDPAIQAAAERFELETGRRLAYELPDEANEADIELFLVTTGYRKIADNPAAGTMGKDAGGAPEA